MYTNTSNRKNTGMHNHYEFEILLITNGSSVVKINDAVYLVKKGDMIFINPLEIHSIKVNSEALYSHQCICFDCALIIEPKITEAFKAKSLHITHLLKAGHTALPFLQKCFVKIMQLQERNETYADTESIAYLSLMFTHLAKNKLITKTAKVSPNTEFCVEVLSYVRSHYKENITSKQLAETMSYNHSYFCRKFTKNFGQSFSAYLTAYRLSVSRKYLEEGTKNISQIALLCGFNSHTYFSKCFKKHIGILPSKYHS